MKVSNFTLMFAFRYALGRMSTAPSIVVEDILNNWDKLTDYEKEEIKNEIKQVIKENRAGMNCDIEEWKKILMK